MKFHVERNADGVFYAWDDLGHGYHLPVETRAAATLLVNQISDWSTSHPEELNRCGTCTPVEWFLCTDNERDAYWEAIRRRDTAPVATVAQQVTVTADCGHEVSASQIMTTSSGTSCPDCYDRMSD